MKTYDAIVIGSGQGGVPLATNLADLGWRVALIEKGQLGGSCINYGCTPTKSMISSARIAHYARVAPEFGIHPGPVTETWPRSSRARTRSSNSFRSGIEDRVNNNANLTLYRGQARFTGPHQIEVNGETLQATRSSSIPARVRACCPFWG